MVDSKWTEWTGCNRVDEVDRGGLITLSPFHPFTLSYLFPQPLTSNPGRLAASGH
jgi:hypothetical protein